VKGGSARRLKRAGAESKKGWSRVQEGLEQSSRRVGAELEECQCGVSKRLEVVWSRIYEGL